jgi:hypothetical protein
MKKKRQRLIYLKSIDEIPESFASREEEAEVWDTHSLVDIWDQLEEVKFKIGGELKAKLEARQRDREQNVIRLDAEQADAARKIARRKKKDYQLLVKQWIDESITREQQAERRRKAS